MAERYTKLFSLPENLYTEGAPVLVAAGALLKDNQTGKVLAQLKLKNICPKAIRALTVAVSSYDAGMRPIGKIITHQYLDLDAERDSDFGAKDPVMLPDNAARSFSVAVTEVIFADGEIQTMDGVWEPLKKQPDLQTVLGSRDLAEQYGIEINAANAQTPTEYKDLWYCACGAVNRAGEASCHTCRKDKAQLFAAMYKDTLQTALDRRRAEEAAEAEKKRIEAEKKAAREAEKAKKAKKILVIALSAAAACIALVLIVTKIVVPTIKYNNAVELMNSGEYEEAIEAFEVLNGYKDSVEQIETCEAKILENELEAAYEDAIALMDEGEYSDAIEAFEVLDGYRDSREQISVCETAIMDNNYNEAVALMDAGEYEEAIEVFEAMDGYKDSISKANEAYELYKTELLHTASVGDIVLFGSYEQDNDTTNGTEDIEWRVLAKEDDKVFVISEYALDCQPYNTSNDGVTWESCTLRNWLNEEFLNSAFNSDERAMIPEVTVTADENPEFSTDPGNDTVDKIFLLSIMEAEEYFISDEARQCSPTDYAIAQGGWASDAWTLVARCWWWLRSPGISLDYPAFLYEYGRINYYGNIIDDDVCVRPAMWISLES